MRLYPRALAAASASIAFLTIAACGGERIADPAASSGSDLDASSVLIISPGSDTLAVGDSLALQGVVKDRYGNVLVNRVITWSSSDISVATVSGAGMLRALRAGQVQIIAISKRQRGTAYFTVATAPTIPVGTGADAECASPRAGWIFCDDFESDRLARYFEYDSAGGSFVRRPGVGVNGSTAMLVRFAAGQVAAGSLHLALGKVPAGAGLATVDGTTNTYRDLYYRVYVRNDATWTGGGGDKLMRAQSIVASNWAQAMDLPVWTDPVPNENYLEVDPESGTDAAGNVVTTKYNDFANLRYLGLARSTLPMFDASHVGQWYCVEAHAKLNDAGQSNGVAELYINGALAAQHANMNWVGNFSAYGINAVFVENYWNAGSPKAQQRYIDRLVVSTQPIGCNAAPAPPPAPPPAPTLQAVVLAPTSVTLLAGATQQFSAVGQWSDGSSKIEPVTYAVTGGSMNASGLYTAGSTAGSYRVVATSGTGKADTSSVIVNVSAATLQAVVLTPASATLAAGATQLFSAVGQWSDGSSKVEPVTYSVTGGSMGAAGLYTAGATAGSYRVIATSGTGKADTSAVTVTVSTPPATGAWISEDFSTYTSTVNMFANPRGDFLSAWDEYKTRISLDTTVGYGGSTRSMKYSFPDRTTTAIDLTDPSVSKTANSRCSDISIQRYMPLPVESSEIWMEVYAKFAPNFTTVAPTSWGCTNNPDYKFLFYRVLPEPERYEIKVGTYGIPNFITARFPGGPTDTPPTTRPASIFDGQWHRFRMHGKVNTNGQVNGVYEAWIDNILFYQATNVNIPYKIEGIWLGANLNQGPAQVQDMWFGRVQIFNGNPGW